MVNNENLKIEVSSGIENNKIKKAKMAILCGCTFMLLFLIHSSRFL